jgi:chromosome segregation ATPase
MDNSMLYSNQEKGSGAMSTPITRSEFEHWQDNLTSYLDRKIDRLSTTVQQNTADIRQNSADISGLTTVVASLVQTVQQNTIDIRQNSTDIRVLTGAINSLVQVVQQNSADIQTMSQKIDNMDSNIRVLMSESARHNVRILALIKGTDPTVFATNLDAANEELDES